jgi:DNA polymerase III subunit delta
MMTPEQLVTQLDQHNALPPIILCCGDEPQRALSSIDHIKQKAKALGFLEHQWMVVEQASDWELLWMHYQEQSLFANLRVMQVLFSTKLTAAQSEALQRHIANPNPDVLLLLRTGEVDKQTLESKWVKAIEANGWLVHSKTLTANALNQWIHRQVNDLNMSVTPGALAMLADWSQGNLMATRQSLLRWQLEGFQHLDERLLVKDQQDWARYDVFALSNALSTQQADTALKIMQRLRETGEELVLLLWSVSKELRLWHNLFLAQQHKPWSQLANEYRLWGERSSGLQRLVKQMTLTQLCGWQAVALQIDRQIKGQLSGDAWTELMWLVADMSSLGKQLPCRVA